MLKKIFTWSITATGLLMGYILGDDILNINGMAQIDYIRNNTVLGFGFIAIIIILLGLIFYFISPFITKSVLNFMDYVEKNLQKASLPEIVFGTIGGIVGVVIGVLFGILLSKIAVIFTILSVLLTIFLGGVGIKIGVRKKDEIMAFLEGVKKYTPKEKKKVTVKGIPKVLDTSVIIDGRIFDICQTGFVEGPLVIPNFVLDELRHISDSSDDLKRTKGRRGLDILNKIQKELPIEVEITDKNFPELNEVDTKLLKLAQLLNGKVITNDYNLNKVAGVQGVPVLNINELSNAVKPVLLPGEEMRIQIIKEGKESNQGIGYLDDGTMIVVENGRKFIGEIINVGVTSVIQTAAGRMIFAAKSNH
ncbi:MAG: PIN/TRAM domain-containing protein [Clostridiaceae bacterium]